MLAQELQKIGLSEKEAKVYLAAMELGQAPVQKISQKAKVNRATTYVILEGLQKKGVISTIDKGKKRFFIAESPHALHNIISEQQEALKGKAAHLKELLPQLQTLHNLHPSKPVVRFYEGKEGLKTMQEIFLQANSNEALMFYSPNQVEEVFTPEEIESHRQKRLNKKIKTRAICAHSKDGNNEVQDSDIRHVSEEKFPFNSDIEIWDDKVMIASLKGNISGVIIESQVIADTFRSIFELAFNGADKSEEGDR